MPPPARPRGVWSLPAALALAGCGGVQSALDPAGREAADVAFLFWVMVAGTVVLWLAVIGAAVYAVRVHPGAHEERVGRAVILGGGVALPLVVLTALLVPGLAMIPALRAPGDGPLRLEVVGEQWWWRVTYRSEGGPAVTSANEVRLPRGQRVEIALTSPGVIHSFWIPPLGGKVDMIPGRVNRIVLEPTETGVFRGVCAEFCGTSHALMAFTVEVMEPDAFAAWLRQAAEPAAGPAGPEAEAGAKLFLDLGCGGCHAVRGTPAEGTIGPDLTHLASRASLGAGILPNDHEALVRWIADTPEVKPDVRMPAYGMLPRPELDALAAYLGSLR